MPDAMTPAALEGSESPRMGEERRTHDLKCWPEPFAALRRGDKPYEIRVNDRDYRVGDLLRLREVALFHGYAGPYTGEVEERVVTYMTRGGEWGLPADLCVLGLATPEVRSLRAALAERERDTARLDYMATADWAEVGAYCANLADPNVPEGDPRVLRHAIDELRAPTLSARSSLSPTEDTDR